MTATIDKMYTIFEAQDPTERDASFDVDELKDIVMHGMSAGVSGFIYTRTMLLGSMRMRTPSKNT